MLLTDEEIRTIVESSPCGDRLVEAHDAEIAKAQLKKVVEWLAEYCKEHDHTLNISGVEHRVDVRHQDCKECWQALLDEVKDAT